MAIEPDEIDTALRAALVNTEYRIGSEHVIRPTPDKIASAMRTLAELGPQDSNQQGILQRSFIGVLRGRK